MELVVAALLTAGVLASDYLRKRRAQDSWLLPFQALAAQAGFQFEPAGAFDGPRLRGTLAGAAVVLKLRSSGRALHSSVALAETPLAPPADKIRLFFGWNVGALSQEIRLIPEIPFPHGFGLPGIVSIRADDAHLASRFAEKTAPVIGELRTLTGARALELLARDGLLRLALHGSNPEPGSLERIMLATAQLSQLLPAMVRGSGNLVAETTPPAAAKNAVLFEPATCTLCNTIRIAQSGWVLCRRCKSPYHQRCWTQATGCIAPDCAETRALPF